MPSKLVQSMFEQSVEALTRGAGEELAKNEDTAAAVVALDTARVVKAFVNIRDARKQLAAEFDAADKALKVKQERLGNAMLDHLNRHGCDSVATEAGTFYKQEEVTPTGSDWDSFYKWIGENGAFDALERRIKKTFVREYMEMHDGGIPPGVSVYREYVVRVRRG